MFGKRNFNKKLQGKLSDQEKQKAAEKRDRIIRDAEAMTRLLKNADYLRLCEILKDDRQGLLNSLLNDSLTSILSHEQNIRLKARIHQIDRILKKPSSCVWLAKNMTEIRGVIKEQTLRGASPR